MAAISLVPCTSNMRSSEIENCPKNEILTEKRSILAYMMESYLNFKFVHLEYPFFLDASTNLGGECGVDRRH